jgi:hypothetical protein
MTLPASVVLPAVYKYASTRTWALTQDDWDEIARLEKEASEENYYEGDV